MSEFNPEMLILARRSRRMTQAQLARASGISQGKVSKYEHGLLGVSDTDRQTLARVLRYPEGFFSQREDISGSKSPCFYFRKRKSVPVSTLESIQAKINIFRIAIGRLLRGTEIESANEFPVLDIDEFDGKAEEIARHLRAAWNMPIGPVKSVVAAIESAGGIVLGFSFGTLKIDAVSQNPPGSPPIFFLNTDIEAGDRLRFTLSHELGHIVMQNSASPDAEEESDRFASEFLMPAREIKPNLARMDIGKAGRLKPYWKTSMQSLIRRAYDLDAIKESAYQRLSAEIGRLGYRLREPIPVSPERPTIIREIFNIYRYDYIYNNDDFERLFCLHEEDFRMLAGTPEPDRPNLRLVQ
jgi:Zn-dependent peptidase ImmA (M78 family)/transcriptional regulator with XRE-family HTH domain